MLGESRITLTAHSVALFVLAGLCEIGGGYLVWQWWRNGAHWGIGLLGTVTLVLYGIVPTYQAAHFGRVYAASCTGLDRGGPFMVAQNRLHRLDAPYLLAEFPAQSKRIFILPPGPVHDHCHAQQADRSSKQVVAVGSPPVDRPAPE